MDWSTVITSASLSAVVGAFVSLIAVPQTAVRQRRAERRDQARRDLRTTVAPLLSDLKEYELGLKKGLRRDDATSHLSDHGHASAILQVAEQFSWWRRRLVERRCGKVFGKYWTSLALDLPGGMDSSGISAWLQSALLVESGHLQGDPKDGLLHQAYMHDPGHRELGRLRRQLRLLAAGW